MLSKAGRGLESHVVSHCPHVRFSRKSEPLELQVCSVIKTRNLTPSLLRYVSIRRYTGCHKNRRCSLL